MKRFILSTAASLWLVAVIAVITIAFTACTKKSETQPAVTVTAESYAKILNGDLSDFAGTWVNVNNEKRQLKADGFFAEGLTVSDFKKTDNGNGAYSWWIKIDEDERLGEMGEVIFLYPAGIELDIEGFSLEYSGEIGILLNDKTKDRIVIRPVPLYETLFYTAVYYREGQAPTAETLAAQRQTAVTLTADPDDSNRSYEKILSGDFSAFTGTWVTGEGRTNPLSANGVFGNGNAYNFSITEGGYYEWIVNWGGEAGEIPIRLYPAGVEIFNTWTGSRVQTNTAKDRITVMDVERNDEVYYQPDYRVQFKGETIYMTFTLLPQMSGDTKIGDILTYLNFAYEDKQHQIDLEYLGPISYTGPGSISISAEDYNSDGHMDLSLNGVIVIYNSQTKSYPAPNDPYANYSPQGIQ